MSIKKYISRLLLLVISFTCIFNIVSSSNTVYAEDKFKGTENAENLSDFNNDYTLQCQYQIWSILKSMGMNDNQAMGILACFIHEGGCKPEAVETYYDYSSSDKTEVDKYVEEHSKPFAKDPTTATKEILRNYNVSDDVIDQAQKASTMNASVTGNGLIVSAYFYNGVGAAGIGLAGFTGSRCASLLEFAKKNNCDWWKMENQFTWMITKSEDGGDSSSGLFEQYMNDTSNSSLSECVYYWATKYENSSMPSEFIRQRIMTANNISSTYKNLKWDSAYGSKIVSGAGLTASKMHTGIIDRKIIHSLIGNVLYYPQNKGYLVNKSGASNLEEIKKEVYKSRLKTFNSEADNTPNYSLYELFGADLHWYRYIGESTCTPGLLDHIWSGVTQNKTSELISFDTINYSSLVYLSCQVYEGRPKVLTTADIQNGYKDPRVGRDILGGYTYVLGSIQMTICKYINSFVAFLMGHEVLDKVTEIFTLIETSDMWTDVFKPVVFIIISFCMIAFIASLAGKAIRYAKNGSSSMREAINRFLIGFLCLIILLGSVAKPESFNDVILKTVTFVDQIFEASLSKTLSGDEVIDVTNDDLVVEAVLWKTGIFNAWCRGQFDGKEYNELYTQYAKLGKSKNKKKMAQSYDKPDANSLSGDPVFNSAEATGDVYVYVGGGKEIRNWAAYLYSCGSKYHMDYSLDSKYAENYQNGLADNMEIEFPTAKTTANDKTIMADTFRIVDAQMNISPQLYPDGSKSYNYTDAKKLETHFLLESSAMFFNTLLLAFFLPVIWLKIKNFVLLIITIFKMIWFSILELFKEGDNLKEIGTSIKESFFGYVVACLKINIMVLLYMKFVDRNLFMSIIYVILCIVVLGFSLDDVRKIKYNIKQKASQAKNLF